MPPGGRGGRGGRGDMMRGGPRIDMPARGRGMPNGGRGPPAGQVLTLVLALAITGLQMSAFVESCWDCSVQQATVKPRADPRLAQLV